MKLEIGKTYRRDDACWPDAVAALRKGDDVERWYSGGAISTGGRGVLKDASMATYAWVEFTVRHLAPREPDWAGARVVVDCEGDGNRQWLLREDRYVSASLPAGNYLDRLSPADLERDFGPCLPLIDADGRVVIDTVMKINGVGLLDVANAISPGWSSNIRAAADVLDALGGGDRG